MQHSLTLPFLQPQVDIFANGPHLPNQHANQAANPNIIHWGYGGHAELQLNFQPLSTRWEQLFPTYHATPVQPSAWDRQAAGRFYDMKGVCSGERLLEVLNGLLVLQRICERSTHGRDEDAGGSNAVALQQPQLQQGASSAASVYEYTQDEEEMDSDMDEADVQATQQARVAQALRHAEYHARQYQMHAGFQPVAAVAPPVQGLLNWKASLAASAQQRRTKLKQQRQALLRAAAADAAPSVANPLLQVYELLATRLHVLDANCGVMPTPGFDALLQQAVRNSRRAARANHASPRFRANSISSTPLPTARCTFMVALRASTPDVVSGGALATSAAPSSAAFAVSEGSGGLVRHWLWLRGAVLVALLPALFERGLSLQDHGSLLQNNLQMCDCECLKLMCFACLYLCSSARRW